MNKKPPQSTPSMPAPEPDQEPRAAEPSTLTNPSADQPEKPAPDSPLVVMACTKTGRPLSADKLRELNEYIQQFY